MISLSHVDYITLTSTKILSVPSLQLEYHNPLNIHFAFICQNHEFKYQLGIDLPRKSTILAEIIRTKKKIKFNKLKYLRNTINATSNSSRWTN